MISQNDINNSQQRDINNPAAICENLAHMRCSFVRIFKLQYYDVMKGTNGNRKNNNINTMMRICKLQYYA